ncbi:carcinoembryonic antigen-related cell adhesion molecule 1-like isoform X2 [Callorhinchus milii]|uniref:carcinoembryonic antigen-related cell adhesion molecule 1-like isoform X2 n=1 Tax=Callorhinchus milii TaxID=7868 RepID=UPI001C3F943C|nr:carcinoembryonic antigen-related cell adhesion molecule 1-like isoform X2 [Callorhinchus milii]
MWGCSYFVGVFLISVSASIQKVYTEYRMVNQDISFSFKSPKGTIEIVWKFRHDKIVDWSDLSKEPVYYQPYRGRTVINKNTLSINELRKEDVGIYTLEYTFEDGNTEEFKYNLTVLDPLSKPKITCNGNLSVVHMICNKNVTSNEDLVKIKWIYKRVELQDNDPITDHLLVIKDPLNNKGAYVCIVNQPGNSEESDPFQMEDCDGVMYQRHRYFIFFVLIPPFLLVGIALVYQSISKHVA